MSKLFNTLEQIRRNESYQVSGGESNSSSKTGGESTRQKALFVLTLGVACFAAVYFVAPHVMNSTKSAEKNAVKKDVVSSATKAASIKSSPLLPAGKPAELNNLAAEFIEKGDHWRGIYLLDRISRSNPELVEPVINLSVALAELGLFEPAKRYLKEAMQLDPDNQALLDNLSILKKVGIIGRSFGPKIDRESRNAGNAWFNSQVPENDLKKGSH